MSKLRVTQVGLGRWGFDWARFVFPGHPDAEIAAVVDREEAPLQRAQTELGVPRGQCFRSLGDALAAVECDAVVSVLPIALHAPAAEEALAAGKHVLTEKPFTETIRQAGELVSLAEANGRVLMVSQNYRYFPATQLAADFVRSAWLGALQQIKVDFRRNALVEGYSYWGMQNPLVVDMAVHHFDLMRMVVGEDPTEVNCRTWNPPSSPFDSDPCGAMVIQFPSGVVVSYRGSWLDQGPQTAWAGEWQMDFEQGTVVWTARADPPNRLRRDRLVMRRPNNEPEVQDLPPMPLHDRRGVLTAFAQAIRTGRDPQFFPSGRANIGTLAIIAAALRSAQTGGAPVRLDTIRAAEDTHG
jgi:predicted dehydrogenase